METKATRPPNDPLTNPQPGDIIRRYGNQTLKVVSAQVGKSVCYSTMVGAQWLNSTQRMPLSNWRVYMADAEVLNVAQ